jgi:hypothetical protein
MNNLGTTQLPAQPAESSLESVACTNPGRCVAVGYHNYEAMTVSSTPAQAP